MVASKDASDPEDIIPVPEVSFFIQVEFSWERKSVVDTTVLFVPAESVEGLVV